MFIRFATETGCFAIFASCIAVVFVDLKSVEDIICTVNIVTKRLHSTNT